jgi:hypothetical protein
MNKYIILKINGLEIVTLTRGRPGRLKEKISSTRG